LITNETLVNSLTVFRRGATNKMAHPPIPILTATQSGVPVGTRYHIAKFVGPKAPQLNGDLLLLPPMMKSWNPQQDKPDDEVCGMGV